MFINEYIKWLGRGFVEEVDGEQAFRLNNSLSGLEAKFTGPKCSIVLLSKTLTTPCCFMRVVIDGYCYRIPLDKGDGFQEYVLCDHLDEGPHYIKVLKIIEEQASQLWVKDLIVDKFLPFDKKYDLTIDCYGDSLTAGYGLLGCNKDEKNTGAIADATLTYAYICAQELNANINAYCYSGISLTIPGWITDYYMKDIYEYTSFLSKQKYDFKNQPDVIVINIGTNDCYGIRTEKGTKETFVEDYITFIHNLQSKCPNVPIFCCYGLASTFNDFVYKPLQEKLNGMENVYGVYLPVGANGGAGHPGVVAHYNGGRILAKAIKEHVLNK